MRSIRARVLLAAALPLIALTACEAPAEENAEDAVEEQEEAPSILPPATDTVGVDSDTSTPGAAPAP